MLLRVLLVVVGLAVCGWAVVRWGEVRACEDAGYAAFRVGSDAEAERAARRVLAACRGTQTLVAGVAVLSAERPAAARILAAEAVRREPGSASAWAARRRVALAAGDARGAARALERLRLLDPRGAARLRG